MFISFVKMSQDIEVVLVDAGNTSIKSAEVVSENIVHERRWKSIPELDKHYANEIPFCICSTNKQELSLEKRKVQLVNNNAPIGLGLDYKTPETLGADRIAAAVGCYDLFPNQNSLLIDFGTCMTMDFISDTGIFRGGVISPGLKMRMRAMAKFTANLPDISKEWEALDETLLGKSTKECLQNGSYFGIIHEINGFRSRLESEFAPLNVVLSGGDAYHFASKIKAHIYTDSKIVLNGLYRIWKNQQNF